MKNIVETSELYKNKKILQKGGLDHIYLLRWNECTKNHFHFFTYIFLYIWLHKENMSR